VRHPPGRADLEEYAVSEGYQEPVLGSSQPEVEQALATLVREGARRMLAAALEEEVSGFLGRGRYARGGPFRGYRNGYQAPREVTVGVGAVEVRVPRVADVPEEVAPDGFQSQLVPKYQRASADTQRLFARLYLEGLATGDFAPVFRELVGATTALSASAIVRLKEQWGEEYATWRQRPLDGHRYAYLWADGVYLGVGDEPERTAVLVVLGAREDGVKELLALAVGYRESAASWADVLRGLRERGVVAPLVAVGDG
jgi:transposase-like protein